MATKHGGKAMSVLHFTHTRSGSTASRRWQSVTVEAGRLEDWEVSKHR